MLSCLFVFCFFIDVFYPMFAPETWQNIIDENLANPIDETRVCSSSVVKWEEVVITNI